MEREQLKLQIFAQIAKNISTLSTCVSKQVGCIIINDNRPVSWGYNGSLPNAIHCCDKFPHYHKHLDRLEHSAWSTIYEIHAEMNAIQNAVMAGAGSKLKGATLICTLEPCVQCTKNIIAFGIKKIYFMDAYDRIDSQEKEDLLQLCQMNNVSKTQLFI